MCDTVRAREPKRERTTPPPALDRRTDETDEHSATDMQAVRTKVAGNVLKGVVKFLAKNTQNKARMMMNLLPSKSAMLRHQRSLFKSLQT